MRSRWLAMFLLVVFSARAQDQSGLAVVAYVGTDVITSAELHSWALSSYEGQRLKQTFQGAELEKRWRHLEDIMLDEIITRKLFAREARRMGVPIDNERIEQKIAFEMERRGLENKDELRADIRRQGLSWKEWVRILEDQDMVDFYEFNVTRRMRLVPPRAVREFFDRHRNDNAIEHRSVDGLVRRVHLRKPETFRLNQMYFVAQVDAFETVADISKASDTLRRLVGEFEKDRPGDLAAWAVKAGKASNLVKVTWLENQEYEKDILGDVVTQLEAVAKEAWLPAIRTLAATTNRQVKRERWDCYQLVRKEPGRRLTFREVRERIETYLRNSIRDQEMKIAKERLWKTGAVRIIRT